MVRHAVAHKRNAERWPDDSERPLTPEGEERFREATRGLLEIVPNVTAVLSSPFARSWRTAEILSEVGWPEPVACKELEPEYPPHKVVAVLEGYAEHFAQSVAVVGHGPGLHEMVSYLLTGDAGGARIRIKKGGVVCLRFEDEPDAASLRWLLTPKVLRTTRGLGKTLAFPKPLRQPSAVSDQQGQEFKADRAVRGTTFPKPLQ